MSTMDTAEVIASTIRLPLAAKRIRVPERTLRNWVTEGRLPAVRVGGRLRVNPADLDGLAEPVVPKPKPPAPPPPPSGPDLSTTAAGRRLGVTPHHVRRWAEEGRLQSVRDGRTIRITEASVAAMERMRGVDRPHVKDWR
jgi:excisionase family DNA binding protein